MNIAHWAVLAALLVSGCSSGPGSQLEEASSAASQTVCSGVFVSGLGADDVYQRALRPEPGMGLVDWALRYQVDNAAREVRSSIAGGFASRSVFLEGRGCTLAHGEPSWQALHLLPGGPASLADIAGPNIVPPANEALRMALDRAFAETGRERLATQAVVVVHADRVIAERYASGAGIETAFDGHSLAKSVVNALIGTLVRDNRLDVHGQAAAAEWNAQDERSLITIEQLMRMEAGFDFDEGRGAGTATHIWYTQSDSAHAFALQPLVSLRGTRWHYSSGSYALLSRILKERIGGPQALTDFAHREVFDPLGMRRVTIEFDGVGTMMGAHGVYASARDWARFGLLYLHDGVAGSRRILPQGWVRWSTTPTLDSGYGAGFWLNNTHADVPTWGFAWGLPGVPADAFMGRGYLGQWIVVVPSRDLVVVRMGFSHGDAGAMSSVARLVRDVIDALGPADTASTVK